MGKAPADQFYFGDYIRDTRSLSLEVKGAWMDIIAHGFFKTPQGRISQSYDEWARMLGCDTATVKTVIDAIKKQGVGDVVTERNGDVTVVNRRKFNEWKERNSNKERQKNYRDRHGGGDETGSRNGKVTPLSSSSSSSSDSDLDFDLTIGTQRAIVDVYLTYTRRFNEHDGSSWNGKWRAKDDAVGKQFNTTDLATVELGIIQTQVHKGIGNGKILSFQYYVNEIKFVAERALSPETLQMVLQRHREQMEVWFGGPVDDSAYHNNKEEIDS